MNWALLALVVALAIAINLPFGAWRTTTRKFSWQWFLSIHLPIPAIFVIRRAAGFGWDYVPVMVACAVTGQILGGWLFARLRPGRVDPSGLGHGSSLDGHQADDHELPGRDGARHPEPAGRDVRRSQFAAAPSPEPTTSLAVEPERAAR